MPKQVVQGKSVAPVYSPAAYGEDFVYVAGQIGLDPAAGTLELPESVVAQANQAFKNTAALLQKAGSSIDLVCKANVYVNDRAHLDAIQEVYLEHLGRFMPCRSDIVVRVLPLNAKIEVETFAVRAGCRRLVVHGDSKRGIAGAVIGNQKIFVSSTHSANPGNNIIEQVTESFVGIRNELQACGASLQRISKLDVYVDAAEDADAVIGIIVQKLRQLDASIVPAVSVVYSNSLTSDCLVEMACVAQNNDHASEVNTGARHQDSSRAVVQCDGTTFVGLHCAPNHSNDISDETEKLLHQLKATIATAGFSLNDVAKVNIFMDSMKDYGALNKVYAQFFATEGMDPPARAAVETHRIPNGKRVAMDCIVLGAASPMIRETNKAAQKKSNDERRVNQLTSQETNRDSRPHPLPVLAIAGTIIGFALGFAYGRRK